MTDLVDVVQKQEPGSELVELIELELLDTTTLYFHSGTEGDLTTVQFRDKLPTDGVYTVREYTSIPIEIKGVERKTDGASNRPSLTVANILTTFSSAIGDLTNDDLIGRRIIRRQTLKKYLVGESADSGASSPPIEFPQEKYIIDRIAGETKVSINFELAAVLDLEGVQLPNRTLYGKYCNWEYQGVANNRGGCTWATDSKIKIGTTEHIAYFTIDDEPIVPAATSFSAWGGSAAKDDLKTHSSKKWRANTSTNTAPDVNSPDWTQVRTYEDYDNTEGYVYDSTDYEYVKHSNTIWRLVKSGTNKTPEPGSVYWVRGDYCGKVLTSCKCRFQWQPKSGSTTVPSADKDTSKVMPFGAFPGSEKYR